MIVNLGSNVRPKEGAINLDREVYPGVDIVADLEQPWPFADQSVTTLYARDIAEHLRQWYPARRDFELDSVEQSLERGNLEDAMCRIVKMLRAERIRYGIVHFMEEAWRVLKHDGLLILEVPSTSGRGAWQDPTHVSYWNAWTFLYFVGAGEQLYPGMIHGRWKLEDGREEAKGDNRLIYAVLTLRAVHEAAGEN